MEASLLVSGGIRLNTVTPFLFLLHASLSPTDDVYVFLAEDRWD